MTKCNDDNIEKAPNSQLRERVLLDCKLHSGVVGYFTFLNALLTLSMYCLMASCAEGTLYIPEALTL